jgi:putative membrane protein
MFPDLLLQVTSMGLGGFLVRTLVVAAIAYFSTRFLSGITVKSFGSAVVLAIVLALLNASVGWLLSVLATPIDFLTFSLFSGLIALVINAIVIKIADGLLSGFRVKNFWWAIGLALILSVVTGLFNFPFGVNM